MKVINSYDTSLLPAVTNALLLQINVHAEHDPTLPSGPARPSFWDAETPAPEGLGVVSTRMRGGQAPSTSVLGGVGAARRMSS